MGGLQVDDDAALQLHREVGVLAVVQAAVRLVLDRFFLMKFEKPLGPNHYWSPKHYAPLLNNSLALFKRGLSCGRRHGTRQQAARFADYRELAPLGGRI